MYANIVYLILYAVNQFVWRQSGLVFFGALTTVGALFIYINKKENKLMKSKKLKIALIVVAVIFGLAIVAAIFESGSTDNAGTDGASDGGGTGVAAQSEKWENLPATEGLEYKLNDDKESYSVSGIGTVTAKDIVISATYQGKPVTAIRGNAFSECTTIKSVFIPDSVKTVAGFYKCTSLKSVTMAPSVRTIDLLAFKGCENLEELTIPSSVRSIAKDAFEGCNKLIKVYDGVSYVGNWCIDFDDNSTDVVLREGTVGISNGAFWCESVYYGGASTGGNMESITIAPSVKYIGEDAFEKCSNLKAVYISDLAAWCRIDFEDNPVDYSRKLYLNGELLTSVTIPEEITKISTSAFDRCEDIKSMTVHENVTVLKSVPDGCETITYGGTVEQWDKIERFKYKFDGVTVNCTDGVGDNTIIVEEQ